MGGRGAFSKRNYELDAYKIVNKIAGIEVLQPKNSLASLKLPEQSKTSKSYVLLDGEGVFRQYREYNDDHKVVLEIGYHHDATLGKGDILHMHIHSIPGVEGHSSAFKFVLEPGNPLYEKYKKFFVGVKDMKGNTLGEFMDDLFAAGGPEKEFTFGDKYYFLETLFRKEEDQLDLYLDIYDNSDPSNKQYLGTHHFYGDNFSECISKFEKAPIFDGLTLYEAERKIEVLYG